ncbi:MAG: PEP/pyruvate-binding domain-containing protein [Sphingomonadaceae bacterium]
MKHRYTLPLADQAATLEEVGGKGASLARLASAGLPVPGGFHVTTEAYRRFVAEDGLQPAILEAVKAVNLSEPSSLETASRAIADLFARVPMPTEIEEAVARAYGELPGEDPVVAVRSSATAEDLPDLSFAGQQETYLNIHGLDAVQDAVKRCWASLWTARAIGYRAQHGIDQASVSLAVVVQLLVPADAAGILFTANPVNGDRGQAMITATWGLGEAIVGGLVTPDTITLEKTSGRVITREIADKHVMTVRTEGGAEERATPERLRRAPVLNDRQAAELARLGVQIEGLYGMPMDIEWALTGGKFAILQARPITALPPEPVVPLEWRLPKPKGKYARTSIIELMPEPLTPLFATMGVDEINRGYQRLAARLGGRSVFPEKFVVMINDYAYYDVAFSARQLLAILALTPCIAMFAYRSPDRRWKEQARPKYAECVARWKEKELGLLPATELLRGVREIFSTAIDHYIQALQAGILPAAYFSESVFTWFYDKLVRRADDPAALTFMLGFESLPIRAEKSLYDLAQWCRERPDLASALVAGTSDQIAARLGEADPPTGVPLDEWREFRARFAAHLDRYGHAIYDLDFSKPVAADDPAPLIETLRHLVQGQGSDPYRRQQEAADRREEAVRKVESRLKGWKLAWFRRLRNWAQRYAPLREDALGDVGLGWPQLRKMLLELGRRLTSAGAIQSPEEVFWLTEEELDALVAALDAGEKVLPDKSKGVEARRARIRAEKRLIPPVSLPQKATFAGVDISRWMPARAIQEAGNTLKGIGASPGRVTATARVLRGPEDFGQMKHGDVLVAAITTPAWTPLFALASAVVTDVGGPLSHSSIVAREYGIPAVLGTGAATGRIHSGDVITVDGSAGTVTLPEN